MLDYTKKMILMGFGVLSLTQKKAEAIKKDLIKQGHISEKEGKKFVDSMLSKSKEWEKEVTKTVEKALKKYTVATINDLKRVEKKIDKLLAKK